MTLFDHSEVTLCSSQDVKVQLLINPFVFSLRFKQNKKYDQIKREKKNLTE